MYVWVSLGIVCIELFFFFFFFKFCIDEPITSLCFGDIILCWKLDLNNIMWWLLYVYLPSPSPSQYLFLLFLLVISLVAFLENPVKLVFFVMRKRLSLYFLSLAEDFLNGSESISLLHFTKELCV